MNWAAALFAAGIWILASAIWTGARPLVLPESTGRLALRVGADVLPGIILGLIIGRLV